MQNKIHFKRVKCKPIKSSKKPEWDKIALYILLGTFFFLFLIFFITKTAPGTIGQVISEEQENLTAEIRTVIEITNAQHLDSDKNFISNIFEQVKDLDDIWSEPISSGEYVRITFEKNLMSENDITIYPRIISGNPKIEVYEKGGTEIIAEFRDLISEEYNQVLLTNLQKSQDSFDLRILNGSVEIAYIFDPYQLNMNERMRE